MSDYSLSPGRKYRYLRIGDKASGNKRSFKVRNDPQGNSLHFNTLVEDLRAMEMEEHFDTIWKILAAILILGEVRFLDDNNGEAEIENVETANKGIITCIIGTVNIFFFARGVVTNIID